MHFLFAAAWQVYKNGVKWSSFSRRPQLSPLSFSHSFIEGPSLNFQPISPSSHNLHNFGLNSSCASVIPPPSPPLFHRKLKPASTLTSLLHLLPHTMLPETSVWFQTCWTSCSAGQKLQNGNFYDKKFKTFWHSESFSCLTIMCIFLIWIHFWFVLLGFSKGVIKRARCRLKLLKNKRHAIVRQTRDDMAELIKSGHQETAVKRVCKIWNVSV